MKEITQIIQAIEQQDGQAAGDLLPLVYDDLRRLAAQRLAAEKPGKTLQATALVHEAYLRLLDEAGEEQRWHGRKHFFAAAAEAMRRILIEDARRKSAHKHGGQAKRIQFDEALCVGAEPAIDLIALDEALTELQQHDAQAAELVKLRFFAGVSHQDAAEMLGVTRRGADRLWTLARTWLRQRMQAL